MSGSLREFLADLEAEKQLVRIRREVDPQFELAAVLKRVQRTSNLP